MKLSVVIVTFNNAPMLRDLLGDLLNQTRKPDHVIVIDNASHDRTESMVRDHFPQVSYFRLEENTGSAGGFHEGFGRAADSSDWIYTMDDDVKLYDDSLENIVKGMTELVQSGDRIGAVRSVGEHHPHPFPTRLEIAPWRGTLWNTSVVRQIGFPRKDYFLYGEDMEYSLRLAKFGYCCYWIPSSKCVHRRMQGAESNKMMGVYRAPFRLYYAFRNEISIYREYGKLIRLLRMLAHAVKVFFIILFSEGSGGYKGCEAVVRGIADGFRGKLGKNKRYTPE